MALRGIKPAHVEKRLKAFLFGQAGAGKTTAAIQMPKPYLIDCERGAENDEYVQLLEKQGGAYFQCFDFNELVNEVKALLTEKHEYKTLVIDPLTTIYNSLLDQCERKVGSEFGRHFGAANKQMKHLINILLRLDMNVIITSHSKNEYGDNLAVLGQTFDCYKKLDYIFDLVFQLQKKGKKRFALVRKSRLKAFEEDEAFEFSYDVLADKYGRDVLERDAVAQELASKEQVARIMELVDIFKESPETLQKWLDKAQSNSLEELPANIAQKIIGHLESKFEKKGD